MRGALVDALRQAGVGSRKDVFTGEAGDERRWARARSDFDLPVASVYGSGSCLGERPASPPFRAYCSHALGDSRGIVVAQIHLVVGGSE